MKLYELLKDYEEIYNSEDFCDMETGEINPVALERLNFIKEDINNKSISIALLIKRWKSDVEIIKMEESRLYEMRKQAERKIDSLMNYLDQNLSAAGIQKIEDVKCKITYQKSKAVEIEDFDKLQEEFKRIKTTVEADKKAIKEAIENGKMVEGASLIERLSLRVK